MADIQIYVNGIAVGDDGISIGSSGLETHGRIKAEGADIETTDKHRGVIQASVTDASTKKFVLCIDDGGAVFGVEVAASPEIPFEERVQRIVEKRGKKEKAKLDFNAAGQLQDKINAIAEFLGLKDSV